MAYNPVRSWIANRIARHLVLPILHRRQVWEFENRCRHARRSQRELLAGIVRNASASFVENVSAVVDALLTNSSQAALESFMPSLEARQQHGHNLFELCYSM